MGCGAGMLELGAGTPGVYRKDSLDSLSLVWTCTDSLGATAPVGSCLHLSKKLFYPTGKVSQTRNLSLLGLLILVKLFTHSV